MAKSHTIPLTDLTHVLRRRQLTTVTFLTTPGNAAFVRAALAGADGVAIVELPFTDNLTDSGAPPRAECVEALDSLSSLPAFVESVSQLRPRFEEALAALRPPASAVVADAFLYWAPAAAAAQDVPTLAFFGTNVFAHVAREVVLGDNPASVLTRATTPDDAVFTVPDRVPARPAHPRRHPVPLQRPGDDGADPRDRRQGRVRHSQQPRPDREHLRRHGGPLHPALEPARRSEGLARRPALPRSDGARGALAWRRRRQADSRRVGGVATWEEDEQ